MMNTLMDLDTQKRAAGVKASEYVCDGMVVGLGTGSTAKHLILTLGERVRSGLKIHGVATSRETADLATRLPGGGLTVGRSRLHLLPDRSVTRPAERVVPR